MTNDLFYERSYRLKDNTEELNKVFFKLSDSSLLSEKKMHPFFILENTLFRVFQTLVHSIGFVPVTTSICLRTCFKQNSNPKYLTNNYISLLKNF